MGAIFTSVAFLEATVNEFFADAADDLPGLREFGILKKSGTATRVLKGIDNQLVNRLGKLWKLGVPRRAPYSILNKFEVALALADKEPFDQGAKPYQEVKLLVTLRNEWIHYEPGWRAEHDGFSPRGIFLGRSADSGPLLDQRFFLKCTTRITARKWLIRVSRSAAP